MWVYESKILYGKQSVQDKIVEYYQNWLICDFRSKSDTELS